MEKANFSWLMFCVATWKGGRQQARRKVQLCCKLVWPEKAEKEVLAFFHWTRKHAGLWLFKFATFPEQPENISFCWRSLVSNFQCAVISDMLRTRIKRNQIWGVQLGQSCCYNTEEVQAIFLKYICSSDFDSWFKQRCKSITRDPACALCAGSSVVGWIGCIKGKNGKTPNPLGFFVNENVR